MRVIKDDRGYQTFDIGILQPTGCAVQPMVLAELGEVEGGLVVQDSNMLKCPPTNPPVRTVLGLSLARVLWKSGGLPSRRRRK